MWLSVAVTPVASMGATTYEARREERVKRNKSREAELASLAMSPSLGSKRPRARKEKGHGESKRAALSAAPRRSGRQRPEVNYREPTEAFPLIETALQAKASKAVELVYEPPAEADDLGFVPAASLPDSSGHPRDKHGCLVFEGEPDFRPNLSPEQVIRAGSWGGCYFNPSGGKKGVKYPRGGIPIDHTEFPDEWFKGVPHLYYNSKVSSAIAA